MPTGLYRLCFIGLQDLFAISRETCFFFIMTYGLSTVVLCFVGCKYVYIDVEGTAHRQGLLFAQLRGNHHQSLVPKAAVWTAVPKWSSRKDTRKCTKRPSSNPAGKASKQKVGRHPWQLQCHRSDKHQNGSRVATPKGSGSRQLVEVNRHVHKTLRYGGTWDQRGASGALRKWILK